ncbi:MAG: cold shock domain-containing protein, partial [Psychrobacter sp.]|nr:cold shock domain-containing protein [Psychrobacter sp.]
MQSGEIKHWNQDKGYGFIDVNNQDEDVFFHVSKARLPQPIAVGQKVYFNSKRNDKNQLRATEVTSNELSILETPELDVPKRPSNRTGRHKDHQSTENNQSHINRHGGRQNKRSSLSTLFSLIAIIAVAVYFLGNFKPTILTDSAAPTTTSQPQRQTQTSATQTQQANNASITGDTQIDNTIALIQQGGPFPYPHKDGTIFYNREGKLPAQSQSYY